MKPTSTVSELCGLLAARGERSDLLIGELSDCLDICSAAERSEKCMLDSADEARACARECLIRFIDFDPRDPVAGKAIWVLGRLNDPSLEGYYASLASIYIDDSDCAWNLRQVIVALDNIEALSGLGLTEFPGELSELRIVVSRYLTLRSQGERSASV